MHPKRVSSPEGLERLAQLRNICDTLPEVVEAVDGFGHTSFRVRDKPFVMMGEGKHGAAVSIKADPVSQDALLRDDRFRRTPYIGQHGWVSFDTGASVNLREVEDLVRDAFDLVAPKSLRG